MNAEEISSIWPRLEKAAGLLPNDYRSQEIEGETPWGRLRLAVDREGRRQLLIPIRHATGQPLDAKSEGVQIRTFPLLENDRPLNFASVICLRPHLHALFDALIATMVEAVRVEPSAAEDVCLRVLGRWRELFARPEKRMLSEPEIVGLIGELLHLRELVGMNPRAAENWCGPDLARHDFIGPHGALEVKTTVAGSWTFEVHGIDQLQAPPGGRLFLGAVRLNPTPAGALSLDALADSLLKTVPDPVGFSEKLDAAGYSHQDAALYAARRYDLAARRVYLVDAAFPKIVPDSFTGGGMPAGTLYLRYTIDLNGGPEPLADGERVAAFRDLAEVP